MKILLVQPPWSDAFGGFRSAARAALLYPPLGLCYLATSAESLGHSVRVIDGEPDCMTNDDIVRAVGNDRPDLVGITSSTPLFYQAVHLAQKVKEAYPNVQTIVGGPHVSAVRGQALETEPTFDFAIYGEGETTFSQFLKALDGNKIWTEIRGLIYREGSHVVTNPPQELISNLDSIPFPSRNLLNTQQYLWSVPGKGIVRIHSITTTRGCPFQCIFCSARAIFGQKVRERSAGNVIKEIKQIKEDLGISHLYFSDDTFTVNRNRIMAIAKRLIDEKVDITFEASTRADCVDEEMLALLRKAGMVRISMGIETGDPEIMKRIKKGVTHDEIRRAFATAKRLGFETKGSVMLGHPGETVETVERTVAFIKQLEGLDQISFSIATPYPGTELFEMVKNGAFGMAFDSMDFAEFKRYGGKSVIRHATISCEDLLKLQRRGLIGFYFTPKRFVYNLVRAGWGAALLNSYSFFTSLFIRKK